MKNILAIIPARGGSKGIPRKNIADLAGKPLIAWSIEAALQSSVFEHVMVSTDDPEIANIAKRYGAEVPWLRPSELAQDDSSVLDALSYDLEAWSSSQNFTPDLVMLLQPTSPLRTAEDIRNAVKLHREKSASSVISVCEASTHPYLVKKVDGEGCLSSFLSVPIEETQMNRQSLPPAYELNGAIYLFERDVLLNEKSLYGNPTVAYIMPPERSVDIDVPQDMHLVQLMMKDRLNVTD